jgi:thiol-disulfide isomerase/thioredoxin
MRIGIELKDVNKGPITLFGLPEHPFEMLFSVLNSAYSHWGQSSSIPVGTVLVNKSQKSGIFTSTIPGSFWANCCPYCNEICVGKACSHMPPNSDQYFHRSQEIYENMTLFMFNSYFFRFCFQYAKIVTSFLMDQSIFSICMSSYSLDRKNPVPFNLEIPILPLSFLELRIMREMGCYFKRIKLDDGRLAIFPEFFMHMITRDNLYRRRQNHIRDGGICLNLVHCLTSLRNISGNTTSKSMCFFESVMKRVLSYSKHENWYMAQNSYFCKNIIRILKSLCQADQTNQLIKIFEKLDSFNS